MEFFDSSSLENHRDYHLRNRECCRCHKVLGNKSKLLTHHRSHTKELPYNCSLCSKSFAELSTLRKHEATHGERNFRCDICSKAFVRKDYLSKHSLTHRQTFKCSQCSFVCHNRTDIQRHLSQHHWKKNFFIDSGLNNWIDYDAQPFFYQHFHLLYLHTYIDVAVNVKYKTILS